MNTTDKKILALAAAGLLVLGSAIVIQKRGDILQLQIDYDSAVVLMEQGEYDSAAGIFLSLGSFSDSSERYKEALYQKYCGMLENGMYDEASDGFHELDGYKDSDEMYDECKYRRAVSFIENGEYDRGIMALDILGNYKDSAELMEKAEQLKKKGS